MVGNIEDRKKVFDSLWSKRCYKEALIKLLEEKDFYIRYRLKDNSYLEFDDECLKNTLMELLRNKIKDINKIIVEYPEIIADMKLNKTFKEDIFETWIDFQLL